MLIVAYSVSIHFTPARETSAVNGLAFLISLPTIYFIPALVAWGRRHHATVSIFLLNLFLGWTFLGWVAALVWSAMPVPRREVTL